MEKLKRRLLETQKALLTLEEILQEPYSKIIRDASIQRFEYTFEVIWKLLKEFLYRSEGIVCNSPKSCFREAFSIGILNEDEVISFLQMTDDRNLTSHTYNEELAENLYKKIKYYYGLMKVLFDRIKTRCNY
jgi:nucleotidyltransferase substrate binding protein (TIGR01987 family)